MRHALNWLVSVSASWTILISPLVFAHEPSTSLPSSRSNHQVDRAGEAIRREVEVYRAEREQVFAKIKALRPAPQQALGVVAGGIVIREYLLEPADDDKEGEKGQAPRVVVAAESFDRWLFGSTGDVESGHIYMESILKRKIAELDQMRRLTLAEKKKLLLAGRGDIKRLFDRIEEERKEFELVRMDTDKCERFLLDLSPLRVTIHQGPFDFQSIFAKTCRKMLDERDPNKRRAS
jgi:hypothetical protein